MPTALVARAYHQGLYVGRVAWIQSFDNGFVDVVVRDMSGYTSYLLPLAAIELSAE